MSLQSECSHVKALVILYSLSERAVLMFGQNKHIMTLPVSNFTHVSVFTQAQCFLKGLNYKIVNKLHPLPHPGLH